MEDVNEYKTYLEKMEAKINSMLKKDEKENEEDE
jgi:hypothetical protein